MALADALVGNFAQETTQTTGTGTYDLDGVPSATFQTLVAAQAEITGGASPFSDVLYHITDGTDHEIGLGTLTDAAPDTLTRDTILESTNGGAAVVWGVGNKTVIHGVPGQLFKNYKDRIVTIETTGGALPPTHFNGLELTTDTDTEHDFSISAGSCRDEANTKNCSLPSALVKQFDIDFAEGTAAGGMATSIALPTTGTVHFFIAEKDSAQGTFDIIGDTSITMANGVTGWTMRRRIGSRRTNASDNFIATIQDGDVVRYSTPILDINTTDPGTSRVTAAVSVPISLVVEALISFNLLDPTPAVATYALVLDLAAVDAVPSLSLHNISILAAGTSVPQSASIFIRVPSDTSNSIGYKLDASQTDTVVKIVTIGWIDRRGKGD